MGRAGAGRRQTWYKKARHMQTGIFLNAAPTSHHTHMHRTAGTDNTTFFVNAFPTYFAAFWSQGSMLTSVRETRLATILLGPALSDNKKRTFDQNHMGRAGAGRRQTWAKKARLVGS